MAEILSNVGLFFTQSVEWLTTILETVTTNPVLLIMCVAIPVVGFAVGLLGRLFRL